MAVFIVISVTASVADTLPKTLAPELLKEDAAEVKISAKHGADLKGASDVADPSKTPGERRTCEVCRRIQERRIKLKNGDSSALAGQIRLNAIIASKKNPIILLNGSSLGVGETTSIRVGGARHKVKCLEINADSALIEVIGLQPPVRVTL